MSAEHSYRTAIPPVAEPTRPLWSVMIPTFNCAHYLRETLESVLSQALPPELMQIEVVDDCSTEDNPEAIVQEMGQGRVQFFRQPQNVGHIKNFDTCLKRSKGRWIHLLHGDDLVLQGFYQKMQRIVESNPDIGAAFCRHVYMNEEGHWQKFSPLEQNESGILSNWLERIAVVQRLQTPSIVVRREVYEALGGFDHRLTWAEDWEMWVRIAAHYPVAYEVQPLAAYRMHTESSTGKQVRSGEHIRDIYRVMDIITPYLPADRVYALNLRSREHWALFLLQTTHRCLSQKDVAAAWSQLRSAIQCRNSPLIWLSALPLVLWMVQLMVQPKLRTKQDLLHAHKA